VSVLLVELRLCLQDLLLCVYVLLLARLPCVWLILLILHPNRMMAQAHPSCPGQSTYCFANLQHGVRRN
jgi:hypothetical protein